MRVRTFLAVVVATALSGSSFAGAEAESPRSKEERRANRLAANQQKGTHELQRSGRKVSADRPGVFKIESAVKAQSKRAKAKQAMARELRRAARRTGTLVAPAAVRAPQGAALLSESFDSGIPAGWTVLDNVGSGLLWTNLAGCGESGNFTGGTGDLACVSSDDFGPGNYDTELRTPVIDLSGVVAPASLTFNANYAHTSPQRQQGTGEAQAFQVDYSTAGAVGPWTNLLNWVENHGTFRGLPGEAVNLDISALVGQANVMFRFRYKHIVVPQAGQGGLPWDWYAQVDDVNVTGTPVGCSLTCPASIVQGNDAGLCSAVVNFPAPTPQGQCAPVICTPSSGGSFPVGTTQVTCTEDFVNPGGPLGPASCSFDVTVNDVEAPQISCPADQEATLPPGEIDVIVAFPAPTASDNCTNPPPVACVPPSGSAFPEGVTPVACTATDAAALTANCGFGVIVTAAVVEESVLEIPAASSIGLAGLALLLAGAGLLLLRRAN